MFKKQNPFFPIDATLFLGPAVWQGLCPQGAQGQPAHRDESWHCYIPHGELPAITTLCPQGSQSVSLAFPGMQMAYILAVNAAILTDSGGPCTPDDCTVSNFQSAAQHCSLLCCCSDLLLIMDNLLLPVMDCLGSISMLSHDAHVSPYMS